MLRSSAIAVAAIATLSVIPAAASAKTRHRGGHHHQAAQRKAAPGALIARDAVGTVSVAVPGSYRLDQTRTVVVSKRWLVAGQLSAYMVGDVVLVRVFRGHKLLLTKNATVIPKPDGTAAYLATVHRRARKSLLVEVFVQRAGGRPALAIHQRVLFASSNIHKGSSGESVRLFQSRLAAMGYWVSATGKFDSTTADAVMTYRRVNWMPPGFTVSSAIYRRVISGFGAYKPKYHATGKDRVEADLNRRVIALINGDNSIYHLTYSSPGKPSTPTIRGRFAFYMKEPGINHKGMVNSSFFHGGYAIHGYASVPAYSASHGCLRIPIHLSLRVMDWVKLGDRIDVFR